MPIFIAFLIVLLATPLGKALVTIVGFVVLAIAAVVIGYIFVGIGAGILTLLEWTGIIKSSSEASVSDGYKDDVHYHGDGCHGHSDGCHGHK